VGTDIKGRIAKNVLAHRGPSHYMNLVRAGKDFTSEPMVMKGQPVIAQIEPTIRCNLRCRMCDTIHWNRKAPDMDVEKFRRILDELPFLEYIDLQGMGEPLINRDLFELIRLAKERHVLVEIITNVTLLRGEVPEKILDVGLDFLHCSIDGATKETFESIRIGANFEKVIENLEKFMKLRGKSKKPEMVILFCAMRENIAELPGVVRLARSLGIDAIDVLAYNFWAKDYWKEKLTVEGERHREEIELFRSGIAEARNEAERLKVALYIDNPPPDAEGEAAAEPPPRKCKWPWKYSYITVDGYVCPCCVANDPRALNFGNIFEEPYEKIWNNESYQAFRRKLKGSERPRICVGCTAY
jgi:radical SAM protein with 4Fe4S-binding SPASM domain